MILRWISIIVNIFLLTRNVLSLRKFYMEDNCNGKIDMESVGIPAGRLAVTRRSEYRSSLSCHMTIQAPVDRKIVVVFRDVDIEWEERCDDDFVSLHDGKNANSPIVKGLQPRICGSSVPGGSYVTSGDKLTVVFQSDLHNQDNGFEIVFTAFHKSKSCFVDEFRCRNGRCISASLHCNRFNNCGDNSDECDESDDSFDKCSADAATITLVDENVTVALILSVFLLTVLGVGAVILYRKRKKRQSTKKQQDLKAALNTVSELSNKSVEIYPCDACTIKILSSENEKIREKKMHEFESRLASQNGPDCVVSGTCDVVNGPGGVVNGTGGVVNGLRGVVNGPGGVVNGPRGVVNGPGGVVNGPGDVVNGPGGVANGPRGVVNGPGGVVNGPRGVVNGPGGVVNGPRGVVNGPGGVVNGPRGVVNGPGGVVNGPRGVINRTGGVVNRTGGVVNGAGGVVNDAFDGETIENTSGHHMYKERLGPRSSNNSLRASI